MHKMIEMASHGAIRMSTAMNVLMQDEVAVFLYIKQSHSMTSYHKMEYEKILMQLKKLIDLLRHPMDHCD